MPGAPVMPPDGFRITQQVPGGQPVDLTRYHKSANWSSNVPGGFGTAQITVPKVLTQKERGLLGGLTIEYDGRILFDGRMEDDFHVWSKSDASSQLNAYGLQRLLSDNSVRQIWSLRDLSPSVVTVVQGSSNTTGALSLATNGVGYTFGVFQSYGGGSTPSHYAYGVVIYNSDGSTIPNGACGQIVIKLPSGITGARLLLDQDLVSGSGCSVAVHSTSDGITYTNNYEARYTVVSTETQLALEVPLVDNANEIRISLINTTGSTAGSAYLAMTNIRVLGSGLREDVLGGFYGGSILRDAISYAPGIYPGTIEAGSDFTIASIDTVTRSSVVDVVNRIQPLYNREWAVWEAGRFDWITPDLSSGGWVIPTTLCTDGSIEQSIDTLDKRTYVTFQDASDNLYKEVYVDSTNARNPYVRIGANKDGIHSAPVGMTLASAAALAAKLNQDYGRWPGIAGSITLPSETLVSQAGNGSRVIPAFAIRAGDNVTIPDLPVEDIYASGQDGQTVFHVTGVQATTDGSVTLTLEGLTRRTDVLLARLSQ